MLDNKEEDLFVMNMDDEDEDEFYPDEDEQDSFDMNMDDEDEEEYDEPFDEGEETYEGENATSDDSQTQQTAEEEAVQGLKGKQTLTMEEIILLINYIRDDMKLTLADMRHEIFDTKLNSLCEANNIQMENLLLSASLKDVVFNKLLSEMYPSIHTVLSKHYSEQNRESLISYLSLVLISFLDDAGVNYEGIKINVSEEDLEEDKTNEGVPIRNKDKSKYITQLYNQGFTNFSNDIPFYGKKGVHNKVIEFLNLLYKPRPINGLRDDFYLVSDYIFENLGINPKNANIFSPDIYTRDEDLMFRTFIREDALSLTILVKLPIGLKNFDLTSHNAKTNLNLFPLYFSNKNSNIGETFDSILLSEPRITNLKVARKVDCDYDCFEIKIAKDLISFKEANFFLRDYIKAARGEENYFSDFEELPLGEKIVVGAVPGYLKSERFDCSGKFVTGTLIGGGAGSGKTALYDSLLVQALALQGKFGDGSAVLIDAKQEWVKPWIQAFKKRGIQLFGFDGAMLPSADLKWVVTKRGNTNAEPIPATVYAYMAGSLFTKGLYETVQYIISNSTYTGAAPKDISDFNKNDSTYFGHVKKLPRIGVFVDELNTLHANMGKDKLMGSYIYSQLIIARLTRTSGFLWFLGGQDPSRTVIPSQERSNYGYNIFGKMSEDRYEYFGVCENDAVKDYENRMKTPDNPNPIISQGMFYAGAVNKTELVKCMYLPDEEKDQALDDLGINFEGMRQLEQVVRIGLKQGFFHKHTPNDSVSASNIVYVALREIGFLTQQEFEFYSNLALSGGSAESADVLDEAFNDIDALENDESLSEEKVYGGAKPNFGTPKVMPVPSNNNSVDSEGYNEGEIEEDFTWEESTNNSSVFSQDGYNDQFDEDETLPNSAYTGVDYGDLNEFEKAPEQKRSRQALNVHEEHGHSSQPINSQMGYSNVYNEPISLENNPFKTSRAKTQFSTAYALKIISKQIVGKIREMLGSLDRVESFEATSTGLVINGYAFRPQFDKEFIETLPFDIQQDVSRGNLTPLIDFNVIYDFKYLDTLVFDSVRLAEGRAKRELQLPERKTWLKLLQRKKHLKLIVISGQHITDAESNTIYEAGGQEGYNLQEKLSDKLNVRPFKETPLGRLWQTTPAKIATGAFGATIGVKLVSIGVGIFGGWGLVFGSFAAYGAYRKYIKK